MKNLLKLPTGELAKELNVPRQTINRWKRDGTLEQKVEHLLKNGVDVPEKVEQVEHFEEKEVEHESASPNESGTCSTQKDGFTPNWKRNKKCGICFQEFTSAEQAVRHAAAHAVRDCKAEIILGDNLVAPT